MDALELYNSESGSDTDGNAAAGVISESGTAAAGVEDGNTEDAEKEETLAVVMSQNEIKDWCAPYKNLESMKKYFSDEFARKKIVNAAQGMFVDVLAELHFSCHNPLKFAAYRGIFYRWKYRYEQEMEEKTMHCKKVVESMYQDVAAESSPIPDGWSWVLQLRTSKSEKWLDWLYVQKSNRAGANLGVFAARDFPKGAVVGYYSGRVLWTCDIAGTERPSDSYMTNIIGIKEDSPYAMQVRNQEAKWQYVDPEAVTYEYEAPLYMGLHYVNNACLSFREGSEEFEKARRKQNCQYIDDGTVHTTKKVRPHTELLAGYISDHRADSVKLEQSSVAKSPPLKKAKV